MTADSRLCDGPVTVYRRLKDGTVERTVHPRAFLDFDKVRSVGKTGSEDAMSFLLVVPGEADLMPGDKVLDGIGPEEVDWATLVPAAVPGLCVIRHVDPKRVGGRVCHVEAGG